MSAIYEENKDEDGFLYMTYSGENTFGSCWSGSYAQLCKYIFRWTCKYISGTLCQNNFLGSHCHVMSTYLKEYIYVLYICFLLWLKANGFLYMIPLVVDKKWFCAWLHCAISCPLWNSIEPFEEKVGPVVIIHMMFWVVHMGRPLWLI